MKIEILNSDSQHPINSYLYNLKLKLKNDHSIFIRRCVSEVTSGDLLFLVSCNQIIESSVLSNFKHRMVLHASDLPRGRGWSPHIWEIIGGAEQLTLCLLDASGRVDCGDIYRKIKIHIPKSALWDEINDLLFSAEMQLIEFAIENFHSLHKYPQNLEVRPSYYSKRYPKDSKIDPNKTISEQFDLIRVYDPKRFPATLHHRGCLYKITLEKI